MFDAGELSADQTDQHDESFSLGVGEGTSVSSGNGHGGHRLNPLQRAFAREYVMSGGNATKAAAVAGYNAPANAGTRNLVNPSVLAEIKRLAIVHVDALLPIALRQLFDIMCDPEADTKSRVMAANSILDRGGMKPKSAPLVQINNQQVVNGATAQDLIAAIWASKSARMSDIAVPMSDISRVVEQPACTPQLGAPDPLEQPLPPGWPGGVASNGSLPSVAQLPLSSPEHSPNSPEGED